MSVLVEMLKRKDFLILLTGIAVLVYGSIVSCHFIETSHTMISDGITLPTSYTLNNNGSATGLNLIRAFNCLNCHQGNKKLNGPAFENIANRYSATESNMEMLAEKMSNCSQDNCGSDGIRFQHRLTIIDANEMALFILSLKKDDKPDGAFNNK